MTLVEEILKIELLPVTEPKLPKLQGFFVKAYKRSTRKKTGFLINSVRSLNIEQLGSKRVRTRISWLLDRKSMEIEEHSTQAQRRAASIVLFHIKFDELNTPQILRGKPQIMKNTFRGKTVEISWLPQPQSEKTVIIVIKSVDNKNFACKLKRKQKIIDIQIEN
ncbi:MAG: hypothetical protein ACXAEU_14130 [Candidatus Hodarchaeales archaeon]|jgi:hypothetical protein